MAMQPREDSLMNFLKLVPSSYKKGQMANSYKERNLVDSMRKELFYFINSFSVDRNLLARKVKEVKATAFFTEFCKGFVAFMGLCKPQGEGLWGFVDERCMESAKFCERLMLEISFADRKQIPDEVWKLTDKAQNPQRWRCSEWRCDLAWLLASTCYNEHKTLLQTMAGICLSYLYETDNAYLSLIRKVAGDSKSFRFAMV